MAWNDFDQLGRLVVAALARMRAARREAARRRQSREVGDHSLDQLQRAILSPEVEARQALEQAGRVRMQLAPEDFAHRSLLDHLPRIHHTDPVADPRDDAEVVADVQDRRRERALQLGDQVEDLRFGRHVESRRRLVHDQQIGIVGEGHCDQHALLLAATQLMRIAAEDRRRLRHVDCPEQFERAIARDLRRYRLVRRDRLGDLLAHDDRRVERAHRILIDHRDPRATQCVPALRRHREQVLALVVDASARHLSVRAQVTHHGERERALARTRFADDAERLPAPDRERHVAHRTHVAATRPVFDRQVGDPQDRIARVRLTDRAHRSFRPPR